MTNKDIEHICSLAEFKECLDDIRLSHQDLAQRLGEDIPVLKKWSRLEGSLGELSAMLEYLNEMASEMLEDFEFQKGHRNMN